MAAATIREAIAGLLLADAATLAILPTNENVFHRTAPQDAVYPFVLMQKQAGSPVWTMRGGINDRHDNILWTVKGVCRSDAADDAEALDARIRAVLHDAELDVAGLATLYCRREEDVDYGEVDEGQKIHHVGAMYRILLEPT